MPKILYVEDELTRNIATIKRFFAPVLKDRRIQSALTDLENSDRLFAKDIVQACRYSSELDIAHTFPIALERILSNHKFYDLIIIDRNLSLYEYSDELEMVMEMLNSTGYEYGDDRIFGFHEREGDLLLLVLLRMDPAYKDKVYYLTANTNDALRGSPDLQTLIDVDRFTQDHIIEKGSPREEVISKILADMKSFKIQNKYRKHCNIMRKRMDEDDVNQFIDMIKNWDKNNRSVFVSYLRKLLDNILHDVAYRMGEPDAAYWNEKNKTQLVTKSFIKGFKSGNSFVGLPGYDNKYHIGYTSIIRNACLSIFEISSDYGVHELSKAIDVDKQNSSGLTKYTMRSLLNQICDVILWYDDALDRIDEMVSSG